MLTAELEYVVQLVKDIREDNLTGLDFWRRGYELREQGVSFEETLSDPEKYFGETARWLRDLKGMGSM
jgi:hypothetical protein